jgi:hypothetical protein
MLVMPAMGSLMQRNAGIGPAPRILVRVKACRNSGLAVRCLGSWLSITEMRGIVGNFPADGAVARARGYRSCHQS